MLKALAFLATGVVLVGLIVLPFMTFLLDGEIWDTTPAMKAAVSGGPALTWVSLGVAVIAPFIGGEKRGWWWMLAGVVGMVVIIIVGRQTTNNIHEAARYGYIGLTRLDALVGNHAAQTVENIRFTTGYYVTALGQLLSVATGVWDLLKKKREEKNIWAAVTQGTGKSPD